MRALRLFMQIVPHLSKVRGIFPISSKFPPPPVAAVSISTILREQNASLRHPEWAPSSLRRLLRTPSKFDRPPRLPLLRAGRHVWLLCCRVVAPLKRRLPVTGTPEYA